MSKYVYEYQRPCSVCNTVFKTTSHTKKCCSSECSKKAMSHRKGSGIVTQEMISKIKELRSNLVTIEGIASELKCSKSLINRVIQENNLLYPKTIVIPRKSLKNQPIDGNKKCSSCKEVLPVEMFVNNNKSKSKKNPSCKKCQNELYLKNKDKIKARSKAYRESKIGRASCRERV
mgnify:CR=1 FL=1